VIRSQSRRRPSFNIEKLGECDGPHLVPKCVASRVSIEATEDFEASYYCLKVTRTKGHERREAQLLHYCNGSEGGFLRSRGRTGTFRHHRRANI
jgi:hypothetical protein